MRTFRKICLVLFVVFLLLFCSVFLYAVCVGAGEKLDPKKLALKPSLVRVVGKDGEEITGLSYSDVSVPLSNLPAHVKNAFIAVEDKRFYTHKGYDFRRMISATFQNLKHGKFAQGASTISQQLVKNTHLSHEKTLNRKFKELALTRKLEKRYSKDEILGMYLNTIYFGHNCFGLQSASEFYFGVSPEKLSLANACCLAGLVRSPNRYSPFKNPEKSLARRNVVLALMKEQNLLSDTDYSDALATPLPTKTPSSTGSADAFFRQTIDELETLAEQYRFPIAGDLTVHTDFDPTLQRLLENNARTAESDATIAVADTESGLFKAFYSTKAPLVRSPGSAIKPLLVYAPALQENAIFPATPVLDEPTNFNGYKPKNYGEKYYGYVSARIALSKSLNVPAVKILNTIGVKTALSYLEKMDMHVPKDDQSLALALGGMKDGFTVRELLDGYKTLANYGTYAPSTFIKKITIGKTTVYEKERTRQRPTPAFSPETSFLTTDMLRTASTDGTAKKLKNLPFQIASKTGTVGGDYRNTDAYSFSYTTRDVVGVWLGNADRTEISYTGGGLPTNFAYSIHEYLYQTYLTKNETIKPFFTPENVVTVRLSKQDYETDKKLLLAPSNADEDTVFYEQFHKKNAPKKYAKEYPCQGENRFFIRIEGGKVVIEKDGDKNPSVRIEKTYKNKTETVFEGVFNRPFIDTNLQNDTTYIYTIYFINTPTTQPPIVLPKVWFAPQNPTTPSPPNEWWDDDF